MTCDLYWGYWQTEIDERDCDKTAFVTRKGQWRFKVLSFGLANVPSQFARIMELVMSGLTYDVCLVYLDDIFVFSRTFDEHLERLATVFDRLDRYSLKLWVPTTIASAAPAKIGSTPLSSVPARSSATEFVRSSGTSNSRSTMLSISTLP